MALALYRRYRPDTFDGVIGQDQVTVPLMRALDEGKLTHAYLFSGPRGCGKTSSARILARCINCANGPTSHPCGECASCRDLATGGPGSIDVVEIDAASHNGVDDARELRERAGFAPARDRYKIFILDEAHMVTQQGFNALLKIVEEPPEHVMFVFATTEPDKVIGTIRSRTHHYPFRLVPAEVMGPYLESVCGRESIRPEAGVLRLAMRAGGGSMRDTLSVLDQLMVGAVDGVISHDAAVALLGFTPETLIGEAVDAVIDRNGEALYAVIQKVVVGGFDPRRFVEDLLSRVRDLLVLTLAGERAESVLSDGAEGESLADLHRQADALGLQALTVMADTINTTLGAMTGAISPRMRLELLAARLLAGREAGAAAGVAGPGFGAAAGTGMPGAGAGAPAAQPAAGAPQSGAAATGARGGFAGASRNGGGFAGASRVRQEAASPQPAPSQAVRQSAANTTATTAASSNPSAGAAVGRGADDQGAAAAVGGGWPAHGAAAGSAQPARQNAQQSAQQLVQPAQQPAQGAPATAVPDRRTPEERWDAVLASLPDGVREYVDHGKVPRIAFATNGAGKSRLSMTFDCALSQHAFALAVATDEEHSGKKASIVVLEAVRRQFEPTTMIAPTPVAANGERVESTKRMTPEQLTQVKKQIALAKAGLASAGIMNLASHQSSDAREQRERKASAAPVADADDPSHRAGVESDPSGAPSAGAASVGVSAGAHPAGSVADDADPWAAPAGPSPSAQPSPAQPGHPTKPVAVPDLSDGDDPWAQPAGSASGAAVVPAAAVDDDPWSRPLPAVQAIPASNGGQSAQSSPSNASAVPDDDDPWSRPLPAVQTTPAASAGQSAPMVQGGASSAPDDDDPWSHPLPAVQTTPAASAGQSAPRVPAGMAATAAGDPWGDQVPLPQDAPDDPWAAPAGGRSFSSQPEQRASAASGPQSGGARPLQSGPQGAVDPWGHPLGAPPTEEAEHPPVPQVAADEDEYSMSDESLGVATSMGLDELKRFFEVKKVEEFTADDPKNPRNLAQSAKRDD